MAYNLKMNSIKRYLTFKGWTISDFSSLAHKISITSEGERFEIIVPRKESLPDYKFRVTQLVESLSAIEKRDPIEIISDIENMGYDIMQFRFVSEKFDGTMPLSNFAEAIDKIKEIIKFEACSELNPESQYTNPYDDAQDLVANCDVAQTAKGSYIVNVRVPLGETYLNLTDELEYLRFLGRNTIARTLTGIKEAKTVDLSDMEHFKKNYDKKLNRNTCKALKQIINDLKNAQIEMNARWDSSKESGVIRPDSVTISESDKQNFDIMENYLKTMPEDEEKRIKGKIIDMKRSRVNDKEQIITIRDENLKRNIIIELKEADYNTAIQLYKTIFEVELTGILTKKAGKWMLKKYTNFSRQMSLPRDET